ncbi:cobaltochelatase subunit CobN [Acetobacter estunensis]|uniref:cobaltochelatase subunit CobN n=1 Tax=Acetobacter estunensis TaxID=104097 RepID=UPI001C2DD769|nr:cobaltochelatase subunit CobN [Acetobacter estunensis]MBV1837765.1 cobaltochelatase subunit CobN [Acetobacter estunensis]
MHLLVRERQSIDEQDVAEDLAHAPSDVIVLSFSDSDLLSLEQAYARLPEPGFSLRVVNLGRLRHPMSIDLYVEQTIAQARCVVVRLLGGVDYWRYGVEEVAACCRGADIPLALLPGDTREDARLVGWSTLTGTPYARLLGFLREGGLRNAREALLLMRHCASLGEDDGAEPEELPQAGLYREAMQSQPLRASLMFYRAHLLAGDTDVIDAVADALERRGIGVEALFVSSLKQPEVAAWVERCLLEATPDVVLNATAFAVRGEGMETSPLEAPGVPILQLVQPGATQAAWRESFRGLSQSDLAMQVVLPELDGRITTLPVSFKADAAPGHPARREPWAPGIAVLGEQVCRLAGLGHIPAFQKKLAVVLSDYPGACADDVSAQVAHAVGLDSFASLSSILGMLRDSGYSCGDAAAHEAEELVRALTTGAAASFLSVSAYRRQFRELPEAFRASVLRAWGEPEQDAAVRDSAFHLRHHVLGNVVMAVQPDRGNLAERKAQYHDPDVPPCHAYVAFYLWLRQTCRIDALVHLGAHGTLEWLPGKAVAQADTDAPSVLVGGLPVIYPFIVNNPGEAAAAKRRLGAVTIGHMTPPVMKAGLSDDMAELEALIDEYAEADGLDRRRVAFLRRDILDRATRTGLLAESGVRAGEGDETEALARLDAYLCDVKDLQIRDGLHVFGQIPPQAAQLAQAIATAAGVQPRDVMSRLEASAERERRAFLAALDGRFVEPGPSGAPTRGRLDVLPTGRNLFTIDPRAIPTPSAVELARVQAEQILTRHLQEEGEPLRHLVMDLWGSASLRTGGEDLALALLLMGVEPLWDGGSGRVSGIEVVPMPVLDRPRVDVTLRISGFFRDTFPGQIALFRQAVEAVAVRVEAPEWNPLAASLAEGALVPSRVFGSAPGTYGAGVEEALQSGAWTDRSELGEAYLAANDWTYDREQDVRRERDGLARQIGQAEVILHTQDHAETDILETPDVAAHEGGLMAAAAALGVTPRSWHGDTSDPSAPKLRDTQAEVVRVVRGRLANPRWMAGMQRHGYRGAAEMARGVEALCAFAATMPERFDAQFDLVCATTLGDDTCDAFLRDANPAAHAAIRARLAEMIRRGLWHPRSNSVQALLDDNA